MQWIRDFWITGQTYEVKVTYLECIEIEIKELRMHVLGSKLVIFV